MNLIDTLVCLDLAVAVLATPPLNCCREVSS